MKYICRIWSYNKNTTCILSRDNELLQEFKQRVQNVYPYSEDWHHEYSEFKEIFI